MSAACAAAATVGPLALWRLDGLLVAFPVMAYSFTAHPYYLGIFRNLQSGSVARMMSVTDTVGAGEEGARGSLKALEEGSAGSAEVLEGGAC